MSRQINKALKAFLFIVFVILTTMLFANDNILPAGDDNLLTMLIGVFVLGLMLNLTPCVYPMLAITVTILGKTSEQKIASQFVRSLVYIIGMATMYSSLGVVAAITGGMFGSLLQSKPILLLIAFLFMALSLSMFGLFELQPPARLLNKIGSGRSTTLFGLFVSGLFVGIFAAPCVGPPVIGLLTLVGQRGDILYGFLVFFVLSLGLGSPYLVLGSFSGLLQKLPRSGSWMLWFKKLFGVLLLAVALFYLSLALSPSISFTLIPLALLTGGLYLGFIDSVPGSSTGFRIGRYLIGALMIAIAIFFWNTGRLKSIEWQSYPGSENIPKQASVLYFSASWCIPCLELDRRTFTDPRVIAKISAMPHFKIDLTSYESESSQVLREKYRIAGVPTLIFLDSSGQEFGSERVVGFVDAENLLGRIDRIASGNSTQSDATEDIVPSQISITSPATELLPGAQIDLGLSFELIDGWHIYWKNPGDSGTEPQIEWYLPEGFRISDPIWITPQLFSKPPFATFGHEQELLLMFKLSVPENFVPGTQVEIAADVSWLVCDEICIGQDAKVQLRFPQSDLTPDLLQESQKRFSSFVARLPLTGQAFSTAASYDNRSVSLTISTDGRFSDEQLGQAVFFPADHGLFRHGYTRISAYKGRIEIVLTRTGVPLGNRLSGVLSLPDNTSFDLTFDLK